MWKNTLVLRVADGMKKTKKRLAAQLLADEYYDCVFEEDDLNWHLLSSTIRVIEERVITDPQ